MHVAVIGGGVIGVCTAYSLASAGHQVTVFEKRSNVAEQASFGSAGIFAPASAMPYATPGVVRTVLAQLFTANRSIVLPRLRDWDQWMWLRRTMRECRGERFHHNLAALQTLAQYSHAQLNAWIERHGLSFEQTQGMLHLIRTDEERLHWESLIPELRDRGASIRLLTPTDAQAIEAGLNTHTPLSAALRFDHGGAGNCPLFTKQIKQLAQQDGVTFRLGHEVTAIEATGRRPVIETPHKTHEVDAVVIAAGVDSARLLRQLDLQLPLTTVAAYSATLPVRHFDEAPVSALIDSHYRVSIVRMGNRIRLAGVTEFNRRTTGMHDKALQTLVKVGDDWFPHAGNYRQAQFWRGRRPALPDSLPVLGQCGRPGIYLNIGHGQAGWACAAGSAQVVTQLIGGQTPDIALSAFSVERFRARR